MRLILSSLEKSPEFNTLLTSLKKNQLPSLTWGVPSFLRAAFCYALSTKLGKKALVIVSNEEQGSVYNALASHFSDGVLVLPSRDYVFKNIDILSNEEEFSRLGVLYKIINGDYKVIIATAESLMRYIPDKLSDKNSSNGYMHIKTGQEISFNLVVDALSQTYHRCEHVESVGQFCVRGGIIDFFPLDADLPYRIEFFGDDPDLIGQFDIQTQRRVNELDDAVIFPALELSSCDLSSLADTLKNELSHYRGAAKTHLEEDIIKLEEGIPIAGKDRYIPLTHKTKQTVFDILNDTLTFSFELTKIKENVKGQQFRFKEDLKSAADNQLPLVQGSYGLDINEFYEKINKSNCVIFQRLGTQENDIKIKSLNSINASGGTGWHGNLDFLLDDIKPLVNKNYSCLVCAANLKHCGHINEFLISNDIRSTFSSALPDEIPEGTVHICPLNFSDGYTFPSANFAVLSDIDYVHDYKQKKVKKYAKKGTQIKNINELKKGDYIVHSDYGIGVFEDIITTTRDGITKDNVKIRYLGSDILYVPCSRLDLISKYSGVDITEGVKLNKLGKFDFQKTKQRVRGEVKEMAQQLIALYSARAKIKGYPFSADTSWQTEFEDLFEYEMTDDQDICIKEIKSDMEKATPMDRLLCGDVGVGKTEVALRAVFKCVADNKQVAILVPTTVLAWQHYQTAIKRFSNYPIKIEMISRFRTKKEQNKIVENIKRGLVDVVIGTHRLLQKDIEFKDLGLAVVDEEQRFGVSHKERLKEMTKNIDVLTLSATPIPRTLNMALTGIRDLSVIDEPPHDRHPIQTYVAEFDYGIAADAIAREVSRGGQVYYLHNRVDSIYATAGKLSELLPDIRIGVGHGQMNESELSSVWESLLKHEIDVLISTTIIETGVDVSNANTIIIEDADRLGLSQLHQIRGRVGRSARRAYAYLMYTKNKVLTEDASKRLTAIREFTEFGSGLKIAMRDLEIRGAGNVLGAKQHGHIGQVGYDLYVSILNEAIAEEKGIVSSKAECSIDLNISAYIPDDYIKSIEDRIEIYKKIAASENNEDIMDITDELCDRFSDPTPPVVNLLKIAYLKTVAAGLNITEIVEKGEKLVIYLKSVDLEIISKLSANYGRDIMYSPAAKPYLTLKVDIKNTVISLEEFLNYLNKISAMAN